MKKTGVLVFVLTLASLTVVGQLSTVKPTRHTQPLQFQKSTSVQVETVPASVSSTFSSKFPNTQPEKWILKPEGEPEKGKTPSGVYVAKITDNYNVPTKVYIHSNGNHVATSKLHVNGAGLKEQLKAVLAAQYPDFKLRSYEEFELVEEQKTVYKLVSDGQTAKILYLDSDGNNVGESAIPSAILIHPKH